MKIAGMATRKLSRSTLAARLQAPGLAFQTQGWRFKQCFKSSAVNTLNATR
jgi:hypothetical protein